MMSLLILLSTLVSADSSGLFPSNVTLYQGLSNEVPLDINIRASSSSGLCFEFYNTFYQREPVSGDGCIDCETGSATIILNRNFPQNISQYTFKKDLEKAVCDARVSEEKSHHIEVLDDETKSQGKSISNSDVDTAREERGETDKILSKNL